MAQDDIERADRLSRKRARALPILAVVFITQQASFFASRIEGPARLVDNVKIGAWLVLSLVLLLLLTTGGGWLQKRGVRALLDDDVARSNRTAAMRVGFIASMFGGVGLYGITFFEPIAGRDAIHMLMTIGIGAALLRFGILERRAHRDG